jgi:hypothetical protein
MLAVGALVAPAEHIERLGELLRAATGPEGVRLDDDARAELGWTEAESVQVMRALGFAPVRKAADGVPHLWRRRQRKREAVPPPAETSSPFAALAALQNAPAESGRRRRRGPRRRPASAVSAGR